MEDGENQPLVVEERFVYGEVHQGRKAEARAILDAYRWGRICESVQAHYNRRLHDAKKKPAKFTCGENLLAPHLGKELTLLFWAVENIDPTDLKNALDNWLGLVPEERWWLYTVVKASGPGPQLATEAQGWRKAIGIAFAESPAPPPADARATTPDYDGPVTGERPAPERPSRRRGKPKELPQPVDPGSLFEDL
jgi:hypothetical protein